jgi:hypothetical protein
VKQAEAYDCTKSKRSSIRAGTNRSDRYQPVRSLADIGMIPLLQSSR